MSSDCRQCFILGAIFTAALFVVFVVVASAQENYLIVNGFAQHFDGDGHCNDHITEGLGWEHSQSHNFRAQIGYYRNSNCRSSWYAAEAWLPLHVGRISVGIIAGGVTGYRARITPAAGLATTYDFGRYALNVITIPPSNESGKGVIWFQLGVRF